MERIVLIVIVIVVIKTRVAESKSRRVGKAVWEYWARMVTKDVRKWVNVLRRNDSKGLGVGKASWREGVLIVAIEFIQSWNWKNELYC